MFTIVEIDKAGRIVIPKKMRDAMHLKNGTRLRIESTGERLVLEPDFPEPRLEMRDGMWVMVGGLPITAEEVDGVIHQGYEDRQKRIMEGSGLE
jgi:AbrB family looped-hinge helix DNA binding protein